MATRSLLTSYISERSKIRGTAHEPSRTAMTRLKFKVVGMSNYEVDTIE